MGLIHKLNSLGVDTNLLGWFKSYLSNRHIRTVVKGEHSTCVPFFAGVPQGSILGHLLSLVNDIILNVKSSIYTFADDTSLTQKVDRANPHETFAILSSDREVLMSWANRWHMKFSPLKTEYVIFSNHHLPLTMDNQLSHRVADHKHLGLIIDEKFKWVELKN